MSTNAGPAVSLEVPQKGVDIEKLPPCHVTVVQRRKGTAEGRVVRVACKVKTCPTCGPEYRRRKADHFATRMVGVAVRRLTVTAEEWPALQKRLSGKADYLRVPVEGGGYVVLTTHRALGTPLADPVYAVTRAFEAMATDGRHVTSSRAWAEVKGGETPPSQWENVGATFLPLAQVAQVFDSYALLAEKVDAPGLEGWEVRLPDDEHGRRRMRELYDLIGLRPPRRRSGSLSRAVREALGLAA